MNKEKKEKSLQEQARVAVAQVFEGSLPTDEGLVKAACEQHPGEDPETLLSFKVYPDRVVLILSNGQKHEHGLADLVGFLARKIAGKGKGEQPEVSPMVDPQATRNK